MNTNEFIKAVKARYRDHEKAELLEHIDDLIFILGRVLNNQIDEAINLNKKEIKFLNFWNIKWQFSDPSESKFLARSSSASSARVLSERFEKNNKMVTDELAEYFYDVVSRPPAFLDLLLAMEQEARTKRHIDQSLRVGKNVAFIFKCVVKTLIYEAYGSNEKVVLYGVGAFERTLKIGADNKKNIGNVGYLQFFPDL